jgi:hypothetical protein
VPRILLAAILALPLLVASAPNDAPRHHTRHALAGRLGGDAQLEGGCAWLDEVGGGRRTGQPSRYEPLWPEGYHVTFDPVRLWGPDGEVVAEEGDVVRVQGRVRTDVATICQVGTPYEVQRVLGANRRS